MDRLQIAIEKARAQRAQAMRKGTAAGPLAPPSPDPENPAARPEAAPVATTDEVWQALTPMDMEARPLRDNRLMALKGGSAAVPFDLLRTRLLHQARQAKWRYIGIVSPTAECGKTTTAANLAFAFARQPELRTVLLDLDLRRPSLGKMMGQNVETSMEDVLRGRVPFAQHARRLGENVAIGFNKGAASNPSELLQSAQAEEIVGGIGETFEPDLVLIDLPPMMSTDDNFGFLSKVDAVLLMAAAEQSTMDQIEVTLRQLNDLTTVAGIVLNKCRHVGGAYGYENKYYYS